jgi:hypothetical protein
MVLAADWQVGEVLWTFIWFTFLFIWIWLAISVFVDVFRSHDMNGWVKALWILFIIVLPFLGIFIYLIARGGKMQAHSIEAAKQQDAAMQDYIRQAAGTPASPVDELHRLADLKERGAISDAEFEQMKAKVLA